LPSDLSVILQRNNKSNRITRRTNASEPSPAPLVQRVQAKMASVTAAQIKYLNDLGVQDVSGLDRGTAANKIQQLKAQRSQANLRVVKNESEVIVNPADPRARIWRQMVAWYDFEKSRGKSTEAALISACDNFDPWGKLERNYPRVICDAIASTGIHIPPTDWATEPKS